MWLPSTKTSIIKKEGGRDGLVAIAIQKVNEKNQNALKWALDNLLSRGQTLILIHVLHTTLPSLRSNYSNSKHNIKFELILTTKYF